jgi:hypothetical protein
MTNGSPICVQPKKADEEESLQCKPSAALGQPPQRHGADRHEEFDDHAVLNTTKQRRQDSSDSCLCSIW